MHEPGRRQAGAGRAGRWTAAVVAVWLLFCVRGFFYSAALPLWEGYDEWAHYAFVQWIRAHGTLPASSTPVSREVAASLELVPLPRGMEGRSPAQATHEEYRRLTAEERGAREQRLRNLPPGWAREPDAGAKLLYEAQQPPLYYLLAVPLEWALAERPLAERVLALRCAGVLLASLAIPLTFAVTRRAAGSRRLGVAACLLAAAMPGLLLSVARVSNEALAIPMGALAVLLCLRALGGPARAREAAARGAVLGLALLTKAYFLVLLPVAIAVTWLRLRGGWRPVRRELAVLAAVLGVALAVGGWWYAAAFARNGSVSGEQMESAAAGKSAAEKLHAVAAMDWRYALDHATCTFFWNGGWSFLRVRSWMYRVLQGVGLLLAAGWAMLLGKAWRARGPGVARGLLLLAILGAFALAIAYQTLLIYFRTGQATAVGWYFYALTAALAALAAVGILLLAGRRRAAPGLALLALLFAALDLFATHLVLLPYYAGLLAHKANGALGTLAVGRVAEIPPARAFLTDQAGLPGAAAIAWWGLYVAATMALPAMALAFAWAGSARGGRSSAK